MNLSHGLKKNPTARMNWLLNINGLHNYLKTGQSDFV